MPEMTEPDPDSQRLSFDEAVAHVTANQAAAFTVTPVFEEGQDAAAGARVFVLDHDGQGAYVLRFVAGPFFSGAYGANECYRPEEIPDRVRELSFLPTRCDPDWFSDPVQVLIQKLVEASGTTAPHMPDYRDAPRKTADAQVSFPVSFIGRPGSTKH
ncbi:MAG TPA: hypothetical protein DHV08_12535 [Rhodocyclaceae bacterium]|nr:MAG: hypothetical protein AUK49_05670 [Betaproteobacteria bacterium CG2_30_68_42]PIV76276.1 MAG: hypothetical protein COW56_01865 [Rhodocyclales bacterium CG17_big_fil_post_rev_8_21_14_2_50_68_7]PJA57516.1 MAG: hypothetical protein CO164_07425 [Rhodocyclales bacterium CG_4_9_14_3_um_filter_68_10]HCX34274.1 hypothetical protein [Rhodocyclaceae bacterium]